MEEKQDSFWRKFLETGRVQDYLQYCKESKSEKDGLPCRLWDIPQRRKWY